MYALEEKRMKLDERKMELEERRWREQPDREDQRRREQQVYEKQRRREEWQFQVQMKSTKVLNPRHCIYLILNPGLEIENGLLVMTCKIVYSGC